MTGKWYDDKSEAINQKSSEVGWGGGILLEESKCCDMHVGTGERKEDECVSGRA